MRISRVKIFECQTYFYQCSALQVPWGLKLPKKQTRYNFSFIIFIIVINFCLLHDDQNIIIGCLESNTNTKYKLIIDPQGKYECVATNTVGTEYSYSAQLYVRGLCHYALFLNMNHQKGIYNTEHSFSQNTFWTLWTSLTFVVEHNSLIDYQCLWIARLFNILSEVPFSVAVSQQIITW